MNLVAVVTKECKREDCAISLGHTGTTTMGWAPKYDRHGKTIGPDPNTNFGSARCDSCKRSWTARWRNGEKPSVELTNSDPR